MTFSYTHIILSDTEEQIYERGLELFHKRRVEVIPTGTSRAVGTAHGTHDYEVTLGFRKTGSPNPECDCPYFLAHQMICKHIIACSLLWDDMRWVPPPDREAVEYMTIESTRQWRDRITHAFGHPLEADLDTIRSAVDDRGGWTRPHAHLPKAPKICSTEGCSLATVKKARSEIRAWMRKSNFDPYFCAGEVIAGFCETVVWVEKCIDILWKPLPEIIQILIDFYHEIVYENIDSSDGVHIFAEAYLERLIEQAKTQWALTLKDRDRFLNALRE